MGFWRRRRETVNEQLLRESELERPDAVDDAGPAPEAEAEAEPPDRTESAWGFAAPEPPILGVRQREDDIVVTVEADLRGDTIQFVTLPDRTVLVEEQEGDEDVSVLATAVEGELEPPYRGRARRQEGDLWAVGAVQLDVRALPGLPGDAVTVTRLKGRDETAVDGEPQAAQLPALTTLGLEFDDFVVQAERLDGDWWELQVTPL